MTYRHILEKSKRQYKKSLKVIPFIFTFASAFFGFLSIINALEGAISTAAYLILLAALMDACDGRLARALGTTSSLGRELDSLCDAISFCLAPMVILYSSTVGVNSAIGIFASGVYLCAGLFRLAKFNLTSSEQSKYFQGLPTPIAAFFIASLVIYTPWITSHACRVLLYHKVLPALVFCIAFLMVSSIPFPTGKEWRLGSLRDYALLSIVTCIVILCYIQAYPIFFFMTSGYIFMGIARSLQHPQ